ncbi:hypothetical protein NH8B_0995 [Pseudogulbenkiania sp. NH8B]|uniref:hypothetical protein n=1 Tax=Pseudogulbenkiania sp. (strain NH8B) TaxID=748280 RepID=UPI0002279AFE|nr:hypothetical protein [Pseudogulbenkiania sp. NH8B]BAK75827.1 hypothetical protein NH8B_0995 [Pseudogulbenkiania sp. NH8B]
MNWRYRLDQPYHHASANLQGVEFRNDWIDVRHGSIVIQPGYAWDGCSPAWRLPAGLWIGTPDGPLMPEGRPQTFYASLVHDALCQWKREIPLRKAATVALFAELLQAAGFPSWRVRLYAGAVARFGPQRFGGDVMTVKSRVNRLNSF